MLINDDEYIVKARKLYQDIEIENPIYKKNFISWIILIIICCLGMFMYTTIIKAFIFSCLFMLAGLLVYINSKWHLKVHDNEVYISFGFIKYIIDFSQLVNVRIKAESSQETSDLKYYLEIEYLNNERFKLISLSFHPDIYGSIYNFCNCFITNKQLKNDNTQNENYYFVRDENLDNIVARKKKNENILKNIVIIVGSILFIGIIMYGCIINWK